MPVNFGRSTLRAQCLHAHRFYWFPSGRVYGRWNRLGKMAGGVSLAKSPSGTGESDYQNFPSSDYRIASPNECVVQELAQMGAGHHDAPGEIRSDSQRYPLNGVACSPALLVVYVRAFRGRELFMAEFSAAGVQLLDELIDEFGQPLRIVLMRYQFAQLAPFLPILCSRHERI
jgi:hypothetical protein